MTKPITNVLVFLFAVLPAIVLIVVVAILLMGYLAYGTSIDETLTNVMMNVDLMLHPQECETIIDGITICIDK